jgi:hypothetical protein
MDDQLQERARLDAEMRRVIDAYFEDAKRNVEAGMQHQSSFAEKLLLAAGAALGVLSTLFATDLSHIQPSDFLGPVVVFILSMVCAGAGLWSRSIALFKSSSHALWLSEHFNYLKAEADRVYLGKNHNFTRPVPVKHPEAWFNILDYSVVAAGIFFVVGVSWTALNLAL